MTERTWLLRDALGRILADAPLAPATWPSVIRRVLVIVGCLVVGMLCGDLRIGVLAAFGALQCALIESSAPATRLTRLLTLVFVTSVAATYLGLLLGGTWWAVLVISALAYVFGATAGVSGTSMTIGIGALALSVIFAGLPADSPHDALTSTGFVAAGIAAQCLLWLIVARPERRAMVRHALANKLRTDVRLLRMPVADVPSLIRTHAQVDITNTLLSDAHFPPDEDLRFRALLSQSIVLTRSLIAWTMLETPSEAERIAVGLRIQQQIARLDGAAGWLGRGHEPPGATIATAITGPLAGVISGVNAVLERQAPASDQVVKSAAPLATSHPAPGALWQALIAPSTVRQGVRMAIGVGIAETLSLLLPFTHSFWLPLTVVFTLRPEWAFTVIRGLTRTVGNLGAVIVLPALLLAIGTNQIGLCIALAVLAAVTVRNFFGNYTIASFGLAGTVLLLDYTLAPDPHLFEVRIIAALLGSLLSLAVALAIPTWTGDDGPAEVEALRSAIQGWRRLLTGIPEEGALTDAVVEARRAIVTLDPTCTGALLEPRRTTRAVEMAMVLVAGTHEVAALLAVTTVAMGDGSAEQIARASRRSRLQEKSVAFDQALADYRA